MYQRPYGKNTWTFQNFAFFRKDFLFVRNVKMMFRNTCWLVSSLKPRLMLSLMNVWSYGFYIYLCIFHFFDLGRRYFLRSIISAYKFNFFNIQYIKKIKNAHAFKFVLCVILPHSQYFYSENIFPSFVWTQSLANSGEVLLYTVIECMPSEENLLWKEN